LEKTKQESAHTVQSLLGLLWKTEEIGTFRYFRLAVIMFADIALGLNLEEQGLKLLEGVILQVLY
jgi:hypothetical protein